MKVKDFDYFLPKEAIAQTPWPKRDECRLLVLEKNGMIHHRIFRDILDYLRPGDTLVINVTKVIPARVIGRKEKTGGKVEIFLLKKINGEKWECILRPLRRIKEGTRVIFPGFDLRADIVRLKEKKVGIVKFTSLSSPEDILYKLGQIPLPPYIKREKGPTVEDEKDYQTVYAKQPGAVAAPTAGLHFTPRLLEEIRKRGVEIVEVILHTGWASFFSLPNQEVEKNTLPSEYFKISPFTAEKINQCKKKGKRVIAVGTTTVRALETKSSSGYLFPGEGWTDLFIYPGYEFKIVDGLVTNFHMPRSSLLLLVAAFVGKDKLMKAYQEALSKGYRFLSYGDAMLII